MSFDYSERIASTGLIATARKAGKIPARSPITSITASAINTIWRDTSGLRKLPAAPDMDCRRRLTPSRDATPRETPVRPERVVRNIVSDMIWRIIVTGVAPIARRMPSSCVRSRTVMSMMFMIPIAPARRASPPKIKAMKRKAPKMSSISSNAEAIVQWPKAVLSSGWTDLRAFIREMTSVAAESAWYSDEIRRLYHPTRSPVWKALEKVV